MKIIYGGKANPAINAWLGEWVSRGLWNKPDGFTNFGTIGVVDERDGLIGAVVYYDWDQDAGVLQISAFSTSPRWMTRPVLLEMFSIPFVSHGCQMVVLRVSENNLRMQKILRRYGFAEYRIPRLAGRHEDQILFTLTDDRWRANGFHREHQMMKEAA